MSTGYFQVFFELIVRTIVVDGTPIVIHKLIQFDLSKFLVFDHPVVKVREVEFDRGGAGEQAVQLRVQVCSK